MNFVTKRSMIKFAVLGAFLASTPMFTGCDGGFAAGPGTNALSLSSSAGAGSLSAGGSTAPAGASSSSTPGFTTSVVPPNGRNYIVGIYQDSDDTMTQTGLGYSFDYTINNSYQDPCSGCGVSGLQTIGGYPEIIDLYTVNTGYPDFNAAGSGSYNANYATTVQNVANFSKTIYAVRINSEFNGAWSFWSPWYNNYNYDNGVDPQVWINGYRNLAAAVRQYLPNAKIIWNPNTGQGNPMAYYPGDDVVDLIGVDVYAFYQYYDNSTDGTSDQMSGGWGNVVAAGAFAKQHSKAMGFPEWGDTFGDGVFITAMGAFINNPDNNVVFHTFWDSDSAVTGSSRLADHAANEAAYLKAFSGKKYTGTYWTLKALP